MIPYFTTLAIILVYVISLYFLKTIGALSEIGFFSNITISMGWIVALLIAFFHLSENRKDNKRLKKEEIKRSLEIDAFREINKAVTNFTNVLSEASRQYKWRPFLLERDLAWDKEHLQDGEFRFHDDE